MGVSPAQCRPGDGSADLRLRRSRHPVHHESLLRSAHRPGSASAIRLVPGFLRLVANNATRHGSDDPHAYISSHCPILRPDGLRTGMDQRHSAIWRHLLRICSIPSDSYRAGLYIHEISASSQEFRDRQIWPHRLHNIEDTDRPLHIHPTLSWRLVPSWNLSSPTHADPECSAVVLFQSVLLRLQLRYRNLRHAILLLHSD